MSFIDKLKHLSDEKEKRDSPDKSISSNHKNFKYLNDLISGDEKEIILNCDIILDNEDIGEDDHDNTKKDISGMGLSFSVQTFTKDAVIEIKRDRITIDGQNHTIDAKNRTQIFDVFSKDIVFKNITFKNGSTQMIGGAVALRHGTSVTFINCRFINNSASRGGGAISTQFDVKLDIIDCEFDSNTSSGEGGVINNLGGKISVENSKFINNRSPRAGVIVSFENTRMHKCLFKNNQTQDNGGAIINAREEMTITESQFIENKAASGGAIISKDEGKTILDDVEFKGNESRDGGAISNYSEVIIRNSIMHENKATFGACIANQGIVTIENSEIKDNNSNIGAAVGSVGGTVTIIDSKICNNTTTQHGGAIVCETSKLIVNNTVFKENTSMLGGAIVSIEGDVKLKESKFMKNSSQMNGTVFNDRGKLNIIDCQFTNHETGDVILSNGSLECIDSTFKDNHAESLILNTESGHMEISGTEFSNNQTKISPVYNIGKTCSINNTTFKDNTSQKTFADDVLNESSLKLNNPKFFNANPSILNEGDIETTKLSKEDVKSKIRGNGKVNIMDDYDDASTNNFAYLDELVRNNTEIKLTSDIILSNSELPFFDGGIDLNCDNLIIDGNNHVIDAREKTRIFYISAENVTLKNIVFKNGRLLNNLEKHSNGGGAIRIVKNASVTLENCRFIDNYSEDNGGAILNAGKLKSVNCEFANNKTDENGGAVYNKNIFESKKDSFSENSSFIGGAVYNERTFTIKDNINTANNQSNFIQPVYNADLVKTDNLTENTQNIIYNTGTLQKIGKTENTFLKFAVGKTEVKSFAYLKEKIENSTELILECDIQFDPETDREFINGLVIEEKTLTIDGNGHTIDGANRASIFDFTDVGSEISLKNITFKNMYSHENSIIKNKSKLKIENCTFLNNLATGTNNLIKNDHILTLSNSKFYNNLSNNESIIKNNQDELHEILRGYGNRITIENSLFINNGIRNGYGGVLVNLSNHADERIPDVIFIENSCFDSNKSYAGRGGVIYNSDCIKINDSEFKNNKALNRGGVIQNQMSGKMEIKNSVFENNKANADDIYHSYNEKVTFKDCTFKDDSLEKDKLENNKYKDFDCSEFGLKLVEFQKIIHENDPQIFSVEFIKDFNSFLEAWKLKCPNDANLTCTTIIYKIGNLSKEEVMSLLQKMRSQKPGNMEVHMHLLSMLDEALKFKGIM